MHILIIGSGAREHAAALTLAGSSSGPMLSCFGSARNPGIEKLCSFYSTGMITSPQECLSFAHECGADLVFIGPEAPLETGTADMLREQGFGVIGPGTSAARIETSKIFARELLETLCPKAVPFFQIIRSMDDAQAALSVLGDSYVIKEDGLCGGKGVKVSGDHLHSRDEALAYCREILEHSSRFVIEQRLTGEEFSLLSFCDGKTIVHMPPVQDHKRALEQDRGPNTGGMGSYSGAWGTLPFLSSADLRQARVLQERVYRGLQEHTGESYQGILYGGYMADSQGIRIIEYNARFGDPEVLNLLPLLDTDLAEIFQAVARGTLSELDIRFSRKASVCKYLVPEGYPGESRKGIPVEIPELDPSVHLFLGSVDIRENRMVTAGSRTLAVTALADTLHEAEQAAETAVSRFNGPLVHRRDIGTDELVQRRITHMAELRGNPLRIGVLGSTRGTSLQALLDAIDRGDVPAGIECIISDREGAYITRRGEIHHIPAYCVRGRTREEKMTSILLAHGVHIVLCVGYMRILSHEFCAQWEGRIFNIHPSLLPDFAGGMDMDVHSEVLSSGKEETGCTIHMVTPEVDAGPVVLQKRCRVFPGDTVLSLKKRVQELEGEALTELVRDYQKSLKDGT